MNCGYPRTPAPASSIPPPPPPNTAKCPECGDSTVPIQVQGTGRGRLYTWVAIVCLIPLTFGAHLLVVAVPGIIDAFSNSKPVDANVAYVTPGRPYVVQRPGEAIWMRVDSTGTSPSVLSIAVIPTQATKGARIDRQVPLMSSTPGPIVIDTGDGEQLQFSFNWQQEFKLLYVYLSPGGATSIMAVEGAFPGIGR